MKKILIKIFILFLPLLLCALFLEYVLYIQGETKSVDDILKIKHDNYGLAYWPTDQEYKYKKLLSFKPSEIKILAVGGSRSMQFRDSMFTRSFYNLGAMILNLTDLEFSTKAIMNEKPELVILDCEQYFFNENFLLFNTLSEYEKSNSFKKYSNILPFCEDWYRGKVSPFQLLTPSNNIIGLSALVNKNGLTPDGARIFSTFWKNGNDKKSSNKKEYINASVDELFADIRGRIKKHIVRYEPVDQISTTALQKLDTFLTVCEKNNIVVLGYTPSWPPSLYNEIFHEGHYAPYFYDLNNRLRELYKNHKHTFFYDFTDMLPYGATDEEYYDGHHASEKTYARMLKRVFEDNELLRPYIRIENINKYINSKHRFGLN